VTDEPSALKLAQSSRVELLITREQLKAETYGLAAARSNFLPTIAASGDYGSAATCPRGAHGPA